MEPLVKTERVRVLIVDDSASVRQILTRELSRDPGIEVVGAAGDPYIARDKILAENPDVLTLDVEMPRMDGISFLKKLMIHHPLPVIVLSSLAANGTRIALDALDNGAVDVFLKPTCDLQNTLAPAMQRLIQTIKAAAKARVKRPSSTFARTPAAPKIHTSAVVHTTDKVIAMGASTGGTEALKAVLTRMPPDCPGILAVIHMPEEFTLRYAERLNSLCDIEVHEAADGDWLHAGVALIARGDSHLVLTRSGARYRVRVQKGPVVCQHRPSVEVLFQSTAEAAGPNAMGVIMTGMGADGANGLLTMRQAGAYTVAQDEESCIVFGMPKEAIELGGAATVLPLDEIAGACLRWSHAGATTHTHAGGSKS
jgi:two-component system chemotaxis response regulator CheB